MELDRLVDLWLERTADRWERALRADPPDLFHVKDLPPLPGNVSMGAFIDAVRARVSSAPTPVVLVSEVDGDSISFPG